MLFATATSLLDLDMLLPMLLLSVCLPCLDYLFLLLRTCCCLCYCYASACLASTTSSSSHRPFLPRWESPWLGWFFPSFLSVHCLFLILFLPPSLNLSISLPHSLPLSFSLSFPQSFSFSLLDAHFFSHPAHNVAFALSVTKQIDTHLIIRMAKP